MADNFYAKYSGVGGGGVTSLNSLTGALTLVGGTGITISPSGSNITITSTSQPPGNYITALTGDGTATGPGSVPLTLATVNPNVGTFGSSSLVPVITVNGKGLITSVTTASITGFANTALSNLTNPTAINQDLIFNKSTPLITSGTDPSLGFQTNSGNGFSGTYQSSGTLIANSFGPNAVAMVIASTTPSANVGAGTILNAVGSTALFYSTADANSTTRSADIWITTGYSSGSVMGQATGEFDFLTGDATGTGNTGSFFAGTGNASVGNSGNFVLTIGTAGGTRGHFQIQDGSQGTSGQIWTSLDTSGSGHWAANPGVGAITGLNNDGTATGPGLASFTLATVNANVGSFGSSTSIPSFTVNAKGLITAASSNVVIAPAGTLTGTTLASNVVTSSLTTVGTIATGTWSGTTINPAHGGTGQTTYTDGQLLIGQTSGNTLNKATLTAGTGITITNGSGTITIATSAPALTAPTVQKFTTGSGTYTTPTSPAPLYIRVVMVGAGGGGGGGGTSTATNGGVGADSSFGTTLLVASGGGGGSSSAGTNAGNRGTTSSLGSGPIGIALNGSDGIVGTNSSLANGPGSSGGTSAFGGSGRGTQVGNGRAGLNNTGAGGAGGGGSATSTGGGGASGGYVDAIITSPAATYAYVVGGGGSAGAAGTGGNSGALGGDGVIVVYEFYQ